MVPYAKRIRDSSALEIFLSMRYIDLHFTFLLTYLLSYIEIVLFLLLLIRVFAAASWVRKSRRSTVAIFRQSAQNFNFVSKLEFQPQILHFG